MNDLMIAHGYQGLTLMYQSSYQSPFQVYTATHPGCPKGIGMHEIKIPDLPAAAAYQQVLAPASFLETLPSHPNVCTLCQSFIFILDGKRRLAIVAEWGGKSLIEDLKYRKMNNFPWKEAEFIRVAADIIKALAFVERHSILHGQILPDNIYYRRVPYTLKLGNFSSAVPLGSTFEERFMVQSEIYSLGLTLLTIASLEPRVMELRGEPNAPTVQQIVARLAFSQNVKFMLMEMLRFDFDVPISFAYLESRYNQNPGDFSIQSANPLTVDTYPGDPQPSCSPFSNVLTEPTTSDGTDDPVSAHEKFQCCTEKLASAPPVLLKCSSSASLSFCQMNCYAKFIENATRDYTQMEIECPICQGIIGEDEVSKVFGPSLPHYKQKNFEKGVLCVCCKETTATHSIECGHLYCRSCLKLYTTKYICASCGLITAKGPTPLDPGLGFFGIFVCGGGCHVAK